MFEPCARVPPAPWPVTTNVVHAVVGQIRTHLACARALVNMITRERPPCERIVARDGFEFREHLGVAVARGVRRELEREARGEAVQSWRDESRHVRMVRVEACSQGRGDRRRGEDEVKKWIVER